MKMWIIFCSLVVSLCSCNSPEVNTIANPGVADPVSLPVTEETPLPISTPIPSAPPGKTKNIALVYDGPGACVEDCALASADSAKLAGFTPKIVGPNALTSNSSATDISNLFKDVAVWVQPGGYSRQAYEAMTPTLRKAIVDFVKNGGGYVGFCAGAFMTTKEIGSTGSPGLGIFPGGTAPLGANTGSLLVTWQGKKRNIYFEGGPYMYNINSSVAEIIAVYSDGQTVAAARTSYGQGRVFISGPHPEAPSWWGSDPDGSDRDLAGQMMKWAAKQ